MSDVQGVDAESEARTLVGRSTELAAIARFLAQVTSAGAALVLVGDPGIGKSALLEFAAGEAAADGVRVLRASGAEFEREVAYSGLHQLLLPVRDDLRGQPSGVVLEVALGFAAGPAPDRLAVANATLDVLRRADSLQATLVVIDDLQWVDRASATVLALVARRLAATRTGLIGATRSGEDDIFEHAGLPLLVVPPLDVRLSGDLLDARFPTLEVQVRKQVLSEAAGNPLALLELPISLVRAGHANRMTPPGSALLAPHGLFASRIRSLPEPTRQLLLLASLEGSGDLRVLEAAATTPAGLADLEPAEAAGLLHVDPDVRHITFRHPLIKTAAVAVATGSQLRQAHRALALALETDPQRRAWHLAEASLEPDESVAWLLEDAAHRTLRRGDGAGAVAALTRSSELTPDAAVRGRRLAEAAYIGSNVTGSLSDASSLLSEARKAALDGPGSLYAAAAAAFVLVNGDGDVDTAHRLLVRAIDNQRTSRDIDLAAMTEALHVLEVLCSFGGRADMWEPYYAAIASLPSLPTSLYLTSTLYADPCRATPQALERLDTAISGLDERGDPIQHLRVATASVFVDRLPDCRQVLWRIVRDGRTGGVAALAIPALGLIATDYVLTGRWDEADQLADESNELCSRNGYELLAWSTRQIKSQLAAYRGDEETTRRIAAEMLRWAAPRRVRAVHSFLNLALHEAALGRGDFETAYQCATAIAPPGQFPPFVSFAVFTLLGVVESAVRTGHWAEAVAHVRAMEEANLQAISSRLALLVGGAQAMVAGDDATDLFQRAIGIPGADRWPFDLARVELAFGEHLRRRRAVTDARVHLTTALDTFDALGARPWSTRAATELRAAGSARRPTDLGRGEALTVQELEVASLAATGMTNKQIAEKLHMSPRTVGTHLYRTYPKLGIPSRAALRDALASLGVERRAR